MLLTDLSKSYLWSALLPSVPVLPRPWSSFVTWEGRLWEEMTANCTSSIACGAPPSYPQRMLFPCAVSLQLLEVSSPSQYRSLVRSHVLVWAHPSELAEGKVWKLTAPAPTPKNLSQFLREFLLEILLLKTRMEINIFLTVFLLKTLSFASMSTVNSRLADTPIIRTAKLNYRRVAEINFRYYGLSLLKGQYHGRYHDFWPKFTKFKL